MTDMSVISQAAILDRQRPWRDPKSGLDLTVQFRLSLVGPPGARRFEPTWLTVETAPGKPITASLLRRVPWASLFDAAIREAAARREPVGSAAAGIEAVSHEEREKLRRGHGEMDSALRRSRPSVGGRKPRWGADHLANVAAVYLEAFANNEPPTQAVRNEWQVSKDVAAQWVRRARKAGLLPRTTRGRPFSGGGEA